MDNPPLHALNMEARRIDRALHGLNSEAAEAARDAVMSALEGKRPDGKRTRKNLRPLPDEGQANG